ncbi:hypothetical protein EB796_012622 [Bugula neritina]|uniref:MADF domain-containing protein n=1 Tax=Bugula neritina TaxID=10212 RepID=A0A7J7JRT5_BUGNE|nr:hypothetical protein EB796_012622 [Bugula neritina]
MNDWQEILINEVRSRRCLWDKSHGDYKDTRTVKSNNWVDVAKVMSEKTAKEWNGDECKKKWANLRDSYMSCWRAYNSKLTSGAAPTEAPTWKWWKYFDWYRDANKSFNSISNMDNLPTNTQAPASPALTEELETSGTVNMDITDVPPPELCSSLLESERPLSEARRSKKRKLASTDSIDQAIAEVDAPAKQLFKQ